jgi:hypothetical protein
MRPSLVATLISLAAHAATVFAFLSAYIERRYRRNFFDTLLRWADDFCIERFQ